MNKPTVTHKPVSLSREFFFLFKMSSQQLPLTVQDDIQAKTKQPKQGISTYFNPRRIRLWILLACVFMSTVALMKYSGNYQHIITEDEVILSKKLSLKEEIIHDINSHPLIVYSKTYCP
jgi:hypothetical protein